MKERARANRLMNQELRQMFAVRGLSEDAVLILGKTLLSTHRLKALLRACDHAQAVIGDTAEIGCRDGGVSRIMARIIGRRHWACDTFRGLVDVGEHDGNLENGTFSNKAGPSSYDHLNGLSRVHIVTGKFPDCAPAEMADSMFAVVHIDVDTYASIKASFAFFASRMTSGAMMLIDDVIGKGTVGAKHAWSEIVADREGWHVVEENDPQIVILFD